MKNRKQSKISTFYTNMGLGVGGRGDTKSGRKGREGKMGAACLCVHFEQTVMVSRAKIQGRHKHGGFCPVTSGKERGNEGRWCLSVPHWVLGSPWCHLTCLDSDWRHWYLDWRPLSLISVCLGKITISLSSSHGTVTRSANTFCKLGRWQLSLMRFTINTGGPSIQWVSWVNAQTLLLLGTERTAS